jgi:hypothetical protein
MKCGGKCFVRPAVGLRLILTIFEINLKFYNTAGVTRTKCGVKCFVRPDVGLRQIFHILLSLSQYLSLLYGSINLNEIREIWGKNC